MPKYLVERKVQGIGLNSPEQLGAIAQKSNEALRKLEGQVLWQQSFVTDDASYCVYIAPNEELIKKHSELSGMPADVITKIDAVLDPSSGEPMQAKGMAGKERPSERTLNH